MLKQVEELLRRGVAAVEKREKKLERGTTLTGLFDRKIDVARSRRGGSLQKVPVAFLIKFFRALVDVVPGFEIVLSSFVETRQVAWGTKFTLQIEKIENQQLANHKKLTLVASQARAWFGIPSVLNALERTRLQK